tara:strand:+ start:512 stop:1201 length:690 start_codon:yes stop_codon:yes gene_type:complete
MKILSVKILAIIFMFVIGLLFTLTYKHNDLVEGFTFNDKCPNLLIKKGKELHLVNTKKAMIPGVNPVKFDSLEDYAQFVEYQKYLNIKCPVLYYQETYDSQNNKGFRLMSNPLDSKAGLPSNISKNYNVTNSNIPTSGMFEDSDDVNPLVDASRDKKPFNQGNHNGMDTDDQNVGLKTILDKMDMDTNPMSRWWKGDAATQASIKRGDFVGRTRNLNDPFKDQKILNKS